MAAVTPTQVRQRIRTRVAALSGWTLAPVAYGGFGADAVPDAIPATIAHKCFAVGSPASANTHEYRSKAGVGALARTDARIRFLARNAPKDQVTSEDTADGLADALVQSMLAREGAPPATDWPGDMKILWESTSRDLSDSGEWYETEIQFSVLHLYEVP